MTTRKSLTDFEMLNMDIIRGTWAEEAWEYLLANITKTFLNWTLIVFKLTEDEAVIQGWVKTFQEEYEHTSCELLSEISKLRDRHLLDIEQSLKKLEMLCKTLQMKLPNLECEKLNLSRQYCIVKDEIRQREQILHERNKILIELQNREIELCTLLEITPTIKANGVPTSEEIEGYKNTVQKLEEEKHIRLEKFLTIKKDIIRIAEETGWQPSTPFEKAVISTDKFVPSDENMTHLQNLYDSILKQRRDITNGISAIQKDIDNMWEKLNIAPIDRHTFQVSISKRPLLEVLEMTIIERSRCESIKKALNETLIIQAKTTLENLWEKCHCSHEIRENFLTASNNRVDNMLELFESEVRKWDTYYEDNKELLQLLQKHKKLSEKMLELDANSCDPKRLKNRGGQLLKEEKQRTKVLKLITNIESSLYSLANKFESRHNVEFTTYDQTVQKYIEGFYARRQEVNKSVKVPCPSLPSTARYSLGSNKRKLQIPVSKIITSKKRRSNKFNKITNLENFVENNPPPQYEDFQKNIRFSCSSTLIRLNL